MNLPKPEIDREAAMELWIEERSDYAKEQLVLNNAGMVGVVLKSLNLNLLDEDLFMTGLIGLVKAVNTFDINKRVQFNTYATKVIKNEFIMTLRKKRIIPVFSLDDKIDLGYKEEISYGEMIADDFCLEEEVLRKEITRKILLSLKPQEREIVLLVFFQDKTQAEAGKKLGLSQSYVSRVVKNVNKKCKKIFKEAE